MAEEKLPDQLREGLSVVFVGTAAGHRAAQLGQYYAHPGNRFWRTLHEVGITPRLYQPHEFPALLNLSIGLTDLSKIGSGMDPNIPAHHYDVPGFAKKMLLHRPRAIAFTSKRAAAVWRGTRTTTGIAYGRQAQRPPDFPEVFVLPSTSGAATGHWDLSPWHELATWLRAGTKLW
jgi:double-stranded uracil-DNA glycosylase